MTFDSSSTSVRTEFCHELIENMSVVKKMNRESLHLLRKFNGPVSHLLQEGCYLDLLKIARKIWGPEFCPAYFSCE